MKHQHLLCPVLSTNNLLPHLIERYTICVSMDKAGMPIAGKLISNTVNKLAEYLNKH